MGVLRVLLALSVIIGHSGLTFFGSAPNLAVPAFFVISGFVIALVLNGKYAGGTLGFYAARWLRLWPSYIIVLLVTLPFVPIRPAPDAPVGNLYLYAVSFSMLFYDTLGWVGFDKATGNFLLLDSWKIRSMIWQTPMAHMWSVGIEITFYLLAPIFARKWKAVAGMFVAAFALHVWITYNVGLPHPFRAKSVFNSYYLFMAGMLAYWLWRYASERMPKTPLISAPLAFLLAAAVIWAGDPLWIIHPLLPDVLLLSFAACTAVLFHVSKNVRWDRTVGELSYAVYLTHWQIGGYVRHLGFSGWERVGLVAVLSVMAAAILQVAVVTPVDKFRRRLAVRGDAAATLSSREPSQQPAEDTLGRRDPGFAPPVPG